MNTSNNPQGSASSKLDATRCKKCGRAVRRSDTTNFDQDSQRCLACGKASSPGHASKPQASSILPFPQSTTASTTRASEATQEQRTTHSRPSSFTEPFVPGLGKFIDLDSSVPTTTSKSKSPIPAPQPKIATEGKLIDDYACEHPEENIIKLRVRQDIGQASVNCSICADSFNRFIFRCRGCRVYLCMAFEAQRRTLQDNEE